MLQRNTDKRKANYFVTYKKHNNTKASENYDRL